MMRPMGSESARCHALPLVAALLVCTQSCQQARRSQGPAGGAGAEDQADTGTCGLLLCDSGGAADPLTNAGPAGEDGGPGAPHDGGRVDGDVGGEADAGPERLPFPTPTVLEGVDQWVAVGDVHGDLDASRTALRLAEVLDDSDHWSGGARVVVQVGDQLDRGDDERAIMKLLERLAEEANEAGGALVVLNGNHETMNVDEDFRYVTAGGWSDFADVPHDPADPALAGYEAADRGRVAAFLPGGPYAKLLARQKVAFVLGDTVFVHGGLLPHHVSSGLELMNKRFSAWMAGEGPRPDLVTSEDSPVWLRDYSDEPDAADCALLQETLDLIGAERMVVAHTPHAGVTSECDGKLWDVDVGLAEYYGGTAAVLSYRQGELAVVSADD